MTKAAVCWQALTINDSGIARERFILSWRRNSLGNVLQMNSQHTIMLTARYLKSKPNLKIEHACFACDLIVISHLVFVIGAAAVAVAVFVWFSHVLSQRFTKMICATLDRTMMENIAAYSPQTMPITPPSILLFSLQLWALCVHRTRFEIRGVRLFD